MIKADKWGSFDMADLVGEIFTKIDTSEENEIIFQTKDNQCIKMYHEQDCCESVYIEDICGDLDDLLDTPITMFDARENQSSTDDGTMTWTFYHIGTNKGSVVLRWIGESNGYYSESVYLAIL